MGSKSTPMILMMLAFVCAIIPAAAALPPAIAQEETSLGEEQDLAGIIVSDVLGGSDNDDEAEQEENDSDADDGTDQDATISAIIDPNQEGNNDVLFGDNTNEQIVIPLIDQDQRDANVGLNLALDREEECPPGFTLNSNNGQCERTVTQDPECPTGFTFSPEIDLCVISIPPSCPLGFIGAYNPETDQCESNITPPAPAGCEAGDLNKEIDRCVIRTAPPICSAGTFNPETDKCEQRQTQPPT